MLEIPGYSEVGSVGFEDRGIYSSTITYYKNDLVSKANTIWKCLEDDTMGVDPGSDSTKWTAFIRGPLDAGDIPITETEFNPVLYENTWKQISDASRTGKAKELWNIGDVVPIQITGTYKTNCMLAQLASFDHDDLADGSGKAGMTFVTRFLLNGSEIMGVSQADGGYPESKLLKTLNGAVLSELPEDLQQLIRTVKKKSLIRGTDEEPTDFECKLYTPSYSEYYTVLPSNTYSWVSNMPAAWEKEGDPFELYSGNALLDILGYNRVRNTATMFNIATVTGSYWLRTPSKSDGYYYNASTSTSIGTNYLGTYTYSGFSYMLFCFNL